jgi:SAM-dependent methyltransferase
MVHALNEIRRVLIPGGILIDLRPMLDEWPVEVVSLREVRKTGRIADAPSGLADDEAANQSIAYAEEQRWFSREAEEFFSYVYSWDTPKEMEEWITEEWNDYISLDEAGWKVTRSAWALADADTRVRLKVKMLIARWKKQT